MSGWLRRAFDENVQLMATTSWLFTRHVVTAFILLDLSSVRDPFSLSKGKASYPLPAARARTRLCLCPNPFIRHFLLTLRRLLVLVPLFAGETFVPEYLMSEALLSPAIITGYDIIQLYDGIRSACGIGGGRITRLLRAPGQPHS